MRAGRGGMRRAAGPLLWLLALVAFVVPLSRSVPATFTYVAGYTSKMESSEPGSLPREESGYFWRDSAGRPVHGTIADWEDSWWEVYDGSLWVSAEGVAYLDPPARRAMVLGYAGAAAVVACAAYVLWARRRAHAVDDDLRSADPVDRSTFAKSG
ncbi:hypothetical protein AB0Q95_34755 [Streptomyces sp. NPDC059900]|uniref:hypothetical protein n=1 Tax=Streptomyces sp. NPDC059900 TaxID=3155816 RepID=UPI0034143E0F